MKRPLIKIFSHSILVLPLLLMAGRGWAETVDRVVAVVNNQPITLYELDKAMADKVDELKNLDGTAQKQKFQDNRQAALQKLIENKLFEEALRKRQIVVTDDDVQKGLENIMKRNNMNEKQLADEISKKGVTLTQYKAEIKEQIKRIKFMGQVIAPRVKVTDADLDAVFAKNPDKFGNYSSVKMAQIIIPVAPGASDSQVQSAQAQADEVAKKARGGTNFEELGKKYSANPQTAVASDYTVRSLAPPIIEALGNLQPNGVSDPVRSEMGFHVIKLYERTTLAGDEYKTIKEQIREKVFEEKVEEEFGKYMEEMKGKAYIVIKQGGSA